MGKKYDVYLVILFILAAIVLLYLLPSPEREGLKTIKTPPLSPEESMKQVKAGIAKVGSGGYIQDMSSRIGKIEQEYPDIPDEE
jgi:hypothetical protein